MRSKLHLSLIVLVLSAFGVFAQGKDLTLEDGVTKHAGIDGIYSKFAQGYRDLDPKAVANLYTEAALYLPPGSDIKRGRNAILQDFSGFFNSTRSEGRKLSITFQILERKVSGDLAYDVGIYTLTNTNASGTASSGKGKFVVVAIKGKDGVWRFQLDTYNDMPSK